MFIDETLHYTILEKTSNEAFQALWIELSFASKKNVICGIIYRQHSPERFLEYFGQTLGKFIQPCIWSTLKTSSQLFTRDIL